MFSAVVRSVAQAVPAPSAALRAFSSASASKRTPSSYLLFTKEKRAQVKAENPTASFGDINRKLGQMWQALGEAEKSVYTKQAEALKTAK